MPKSIAARISLLLLLLPLLACGGLFGGDDSPPYHPPQERSVVIEYLNNSAADVHMVYGPTANLDQATRVNAGLSRQETRSLVFFDNATPGTFTFTVASPSMQPTQGTITLYPYQVNDGDHLRVVWDGTNVTVTKV